VFDFRTVSQRYSAATSLRRSSDHDSDSNNENVVLDNSYIETAIFNLFKIDIINFIKTKAILAKEFHIQPSEFDNMPAWEFEIFMKEINEAVKEENERNKQEMDKSGISEAQKMSNPNNVRRMQNAHMSKMPSLGSMSTNMGSFKMPKL
jgi:hypothetical protein